MSELQEGRDYKLIYRCTAADDNYSVRSCGVCFTDKKELEKHVLTAHLRPEQVAELFTFLAQKGLNVAQVINILSGGNDLISYIKSQATVIVGLEERLIQKSEEAEKAAQEAAKWTRVNDALLAQNEANSFKDMGNQEAYRAATHIAHLIRTQNEEVRSE